MTNIFWPPTSPTTLKRLCAETQARELQWYLTHLHTNVLPELKSGLLDCDQLLSPDSGAHTLVLSSLRSESIKGTVTRVGTRIIKGDVAIKLSSIPPPKGKDSHRMTINTAPDAPTLVVEELKKVRDLISQALDVVDVTAWTGHKDDAGFMRGQLQLLWEHVAEAKSMLKGSGTAAAIEAGTTRPQTPSSRPRTPIGDPASRARTPAQDIHNLPSRSRTPNIEPSSLSRTPASGPASRPRSPPPHGPETLKPPPAVADTHPQPDSSQPSATPWHTHPHDPAIFTPPPPSNLNFHLSISDASLILQIRTLELASAPPSSDSFTGFGIRERLGLTSKLPTHEEVGQVFEYRGEEVRVKEKLRVGSQDPSLLAAMAKLEALGRSVGVSRGALESLLTGGFKERAGVHRL